MATPLIHSFSRKLRRPLLIFTIGLLPMLAGLATMHWNLRHTLTRQSLTSAQSAVTEIERILDAADLALEQVASRASENCRIELIDDLRSLVFSHPYLRSAYLGRHGQVYCGSYHGSHAHEENLAIGPLIPLQLLHDDAITPSRSVLVMQRATQQNDTAHVSVQGSTLAKPLMLLSPGIDNHLQINQRWLDEQGRVLEHDPTLSMEFTQQVASQRYAFSASGGYATGTFEVVYRRQALSLMGSLTMMSLLLGWLVSRLLPQERQQLRPPALA